MTTGTAAGTVALGLPLAIGVASPVVVHAAVGTVPLPSIVVRSGLAGPISVFAATGLGVLPAIRGGGGSTAIQIPNTNLPVFPPTTTPTSNLSSLLGDDPGLQRLYDNILGTVPSTTLPVVQLAAWNTIEDFYLRSTARRALMNWTMAVGVQQLDFNPYDEQWLVAWVLDVCGLTRYQVIPPAVLMDLSSPAQVRTGTVLLALKPVANGYVGDPYLFQQWFETILAGTLYRLYAMPAKPFTSPQLAQFNGLRFTAGINRARAIADAGNTNGAGRWRYPYFAAGRRKQ